MPGFRQGILEEMRKKLIVSGCSFTEKAFRSVSYPDRSFDFKKWPELLAEKLGMECVNLAFSGAGNRFILSSLTDAIIRTPKEEIGLVIAAWSQSNRDDYQIFKDTDRMFFNERFIKGFRWMNERKDRPGDVFGWTRETILGYIQFQNLCERYNLPYKQFQMISLFEGWLAGLIETEEQIKRRLEREHGRVLSAEEIEDLKRNEGPDRHEYQIISKKGKKTSDVREDRHLLAKLLSSYDQYIDQKNFLGWPGIRYMGGHTIENKCLMREVKRPDGKFRHHEVIEDLVVGFLDRHPNKHGHEKIMEYIYEQLG